MGRTFRPTAPAADVAHPEIRADAVAVSHDRAVGTSSSRPRVWGLDWSRLTPFLRSSSGKGLLIYLVVALFVSAGGGISFYFASVSSFKQYKAEEQITALQLIDAFVTTYSSTRPLAAENTPVPATFRAHSIERFNQSKGEISDFSLRWVGRLGREISTPPADDVTARIIEAFASNPLSKPASLFTTAGEQSILRTVYPSLAHEQSCIDCHNALQPTKATWQLNDVMGAFVIDVPTTTVFRQSVLRSAVFTVLSLATLGAVGVAFSLLHFRQTTTQETAEIQLSHRVDQRTAELQEARKELLGRYEADARYLEWLRRLATFLRHEVRQPVAQITSSVELIQIANRSSVEIKPYILSALQGAQHVWNLVERASRATDVEAFVRQGQSQPVEVQSLLAELIAGYRQTYSGIDFRFRSSSGPFVVAADETLLKEAVGNLMTNAASFATEGSSVHLTLQREGDLVEIRVSNCGSLIEGDPELLFGPFASTRAGPASEHHGLGLYLVRLIAQHYGGKADIANASDGSGVEASIRLPARS